MSINDAGLALIKSFEGCSLKVYADVGGLATVGYGHRTSLPIGTEITQEQADDFLRQDLQSTEDGVSKLITTKPNSNQFSACVCFAYNVGVGNFAKSTLLRCINNNNWDDATKAFAPWDRVDGREVEGLVRRRAAEASLFKKISDL